MLTGRRYGGTLLISWPLITMRPASGISNPASMRNSVVLPQPEPPSRANSSPRSIERSTPSTAVTLPKRLVAPSMRTIGGVALLSLVIAPASSAGLDRCPQSRALAHLFGIAGSDGIEAGAHGGRRIDQGIVGDGLGQQRRRRLVGVGVARELARGGGDLGFEHEVDKAQGLFGIGRILGDRRDVNPQQRAFLGDGVGDVL